jgi:hypothetical protein
MVTVRFLAGDEKGRRGGGTCPDLIGTPPPLVEFDGEMAG